MKALVIYDSYFGNTQQVAEAIAKELGADSRAIKVSDVAKSDLEGLDFVVLGSPIRGWQPSEDTKVFLDSLGKDDLKGVEATTFDTRVKLFIHGDAKGKMAKRLEAVGAKISVEPAAFYVGGQEGPLLEGEMKNAVEWAKLIRQKVAS